MTQDETAGRLSRLERHQDVFEYRLGVMDRDLADFHQRQLATNRMLQAVATTQSEHTAALRELTERVDGLGRKLEDHDRRFDGIDTRFDGIDTRFDAVEAQLGEVKGQLSTVIGLLGGPPAQA